MFKRFRRFIAIPAGQRRLLGEAAFLMLLAKVLLKVKPVRSVLEISFEGERSEQDNDLNVAAEIKNAIYRADRVLFRRNRCLVKSLAGRWMLQRRNIPCIISFGMMHGTDKEPVAHSWLTTDGFEVVDKGGDYLELASY